MFKWLLNLFSPGRGRQSANVDYSEVEAMTLEQAIEKAKQGYRIKRMNEWQVSPLLWNGERLVYTPSNLWYEPDEADYVSCDWVTCGKVGE